MREALRLRQRKTRPAFKRRAIKRQLRRAGREIPADAMFDIGALRRLRGEPWQ